MMTFEQEIFSKSRYSYNSVKVTATMIGVRCSADGQSFGTGTIQCYSPWTNGFSNLKDIQAPDGDDSLIEAEVDRVQILMKSMKQIMSRQKPLQWERLYKTLQVQKRTNHSRLDKELFTSSQEEFY